MRFNVFVIAIFCLTVGFFAKADQEGTATSKFAPVSMSQSELNSLLVTILDIAEKHPIKCTIIPKGTSVKNSADVVFNFIAYGSSEKLYTNGPQQLVVLNLLDNKNAVGRMLISSASKSIISIKFVATPSDGQDAAEWTCHNSSVGAY